MPYITTVWIAVGATEFYDLHYLYALQIADWTNTNIMLHGNLACKYIGSLYLLLKLKFKTLV